MVINRPKDFLGRDEQMCHLPNRHLKVHLREFEEPAMSCHDHQLFLDPSFRRNGTAWCVAPPKGRRRRLINIPFEEPRHPHAVSARGGCSRATEGWSVAMLSRY